MNASSDQGLFIPSPADQLPGTNPGNPTLSSPSHARASPKVVPIQHPHFDPDEADPTMQQTPHTDSRRAKVMKYWSYFSFPLHTTTSSSSREHPPPSSHLTIIPSCPPSPTSNSLIHTTHRAAVPRPSSRITKAKMPPCLS